MPDKYFVSVLV